MSDTEAYTDALLEALGAEIRSWRQRRGLSRLQVAKRVGISETTMGRIERDGPADVGDTWRIARELRVPFAELVRRAEEAAELAAGPLSRYDRPNEGLPPEEREELMQAADEEHRRSDIGWSQQEIYLTGGSPVWGGELSAATDRSDDAIAADEQESSIAGEAEQPTEP